ncbi:hypothetical protein GOP47_0013670 [Adiantum capillus-veneris]|uniref:Uncharacterized protein n=1 Tax=Adiantum capillus-veneris TaxID=13818 RepID=A0A9D4UNZ2_ADICA|nr:hypothetical protein GOP47_0013670 [Adiantum capillus-veneris]
MLPLEHANLKTFFSCNLVFLTRSETGDFDKSCWYAASKAFRIRKLILPSLLQLVALNLKGKHNCRILTLDYETGQGMRESRLHRWPTHMSCPDHSP